jgi:hypothetical protein
MFVSSRLICLLRVLELVFVALIGWKVVSCMLSYI